MRNEKARDLLAMIEVKEPNELIVKSWWGSFVKDYEEALDKAIKALEQGHGRKFEEIVVEYPPAELCTYPKYRGKPYFSIKYEENGEHFIGFGTYKPEVLSMYLQEYFIVPTITESEVQE